MWTVLNIFFLLFILTTYSLLGNTFLFLCFSFVQYMIIYVCLLKNQKNPKTKKYELKPQNKANIKR